MLRREAVAVLLAAGASGTKLPAIDRFFDGAAGTGVLLDIPGRRLIAAHRAQVASGEAVPPGSTVKPLVLAALLRLNRLRAEEGFACPGELSIGGRSLACSHPALDRPVTVRTAITYSCNCYVAHFAARFRPGELAQALERAGLGASTGLFGPNEGAGRVRAAGSPEQNRLQALGESDVLVTAAGLAMAYRGLARNAPPAIREGLEDAVEFGTAQHARVASMRVAGKTGSTGTVQLGRLAWFVGFAPSRAPEVAAAVMLHGRSGGADAAPVAGRILDAWRAGRL